ncbi:HTH domain-containing protein [Corynebacterium sp. TA-R-1]|uniref:HTH domain-containing protein n=1 Tax=Corynebacterium stercoris TaxID=2943490 RepID=A0ABT1G187_9CORY|nr:HTH domain-containing protein [Corynebacterium stercoris]MCP1387607.1 HTH domain-containing protein [Corynebacterium stercoris]
MSDTSEPAPHERVPTALRGLRMLELMQWGSRFTTAELASELGVSQSAIRKYVAQLRGADFKIKSGPGFGGCYWIERGERAFPLQLTTDEIELVLLGLAAFSAAGGADDPRSAAAFELHRRILEIVPVEVAEKLDGFTDKFRKKLQMMSAVFRAQHGTKLDHLWA